jgi:rhodanese-related sulfurtransferase
MRTMNIALLLLLMISAVADCRTESLASVTSSPGGSAQSQETTSAQDGPFASAPRLTIRELQDAIKRRDVVIVDVSPAEAFALEHIKGAISIPFDDFLDNTSKLPQDKLIVTYCA